MAAHPEGSTLSFISALGHQVEVVVVHHEHIDATRIR